MKFLLVWGLISHAWLFVSAQSYLEATNLMGISHSYTGIYGSGASAYDWNKDELPDLVLLRKDLDPLFYLNMGNHFELQEPFIQNSGDIKSICWVDYDNDGDPDISINRDAGAFELFNNDGNFNFESVNASAGLPFTTNLGTGQSWVDYNLDGWLDLYICNYNAFDFITNYLFQNNGDGTFSNVTLLKQIGDGSRNTFQSAWVDFNFDLLPDLHVINDKITPNSMYLNQGDLPFDDISAEAGVNVIIDAMSNTIADYDNDGDYDIYVSNNSQGNILFRNDGGINYVDVADELGVAVNMMCWGATFTDLNKDGWLDLVVNTSAIGNILQQNKMFLNNQIGGFNSVLNSFSQQINNSFAILDADFDNDGDIDIVTINAEPNQSSFWQCNQVNGYWIKLNLQGVISNRDAIGTHVKLWNNGICQMRYTLCGQNYLVQNSQYLHFGLFNDNNVDSVIINWPSGHIDKFYSLPSNTTHHIIEGSSLTAVVSHTEDLFICENQSITLHSFENFPQILWNNGESESSTTVSDPGQYWFEATTELGFVVYSDTVEVALVPPPVIQFELNHPSCFQSTDGSILAQINDEYLPLEFIWNTGELSENISNLPAGEYELSVTNAQGCSSELSISLSEPLPLQAEAAIIHAFENEHGEITVTASGGTPPYSFLWSNGSVESAISELESAWYDLTLSDAQLCTEDYSFFVDNFTGISYIQENLPQLFPNPVDDVLFINKLDYDNEIKMYDCSGRVVYCSINVESTTNINMQGIADGLYYIHIKSGENYLNYKIVVKH
jgi:hypothetical protein